MIYNFNESQKNFESQQYDVCICGAGAAGITLAWYIASNSNKRVALLEGGGDEYSQQSQELYQGKTIGMEYYLDTTRLRYFGGTTNHWTGRCRPFDKTDFRQRDFDGLPGWPINFEEIDRYLPEAKEILDLPQENTFKVLMGTIMKSQKFIADEYIKSNPVRFGVKYYDFLKTKPNLDVFLNANLTDIILAPDLKTVEKVNVRSFNGKQQYLKAEKFILCLGGIENARILLCSNKQIKTGIGNKTDMVGRCFMEHYNIEFGGFIGAPDKWEDKGVSVMAFFTDPVYAKSNQLSMGNIAFSLVAELKAYGRTKELKKLLNKLSCKLGISDSVQFLYKHKCLGEGVVTTLLEQSPNKLSRVFLDDELDAFGLNKIVMDWQMSSNDIKSIKQLATEIAKEFAQNDLGRVKLNSYVLEDSKEQIPSVVHSHHMGTTRMAKSDEHGVVDTNCQVFDTKNLYVAGSSVFSTGGGGNPTMPIVQLALRMGDHLLHS